MMSPALPLGNLSPNFAKAEFVASEYAARKGIDNTPPILTWENLWALATTVLEPARTALGPIRISSGFRCEALNRAIGGARASQHLTGEAADLIPLRASLGELLRWIVGNAPFDQVIYEFGQWVHVSHVRAPGMQRGSILIATKDARNRTRYAPLSEEGVAALL